MINLRWLAVIGICIALLAARWVDWVPDLGPAFAVVADSTVRSLAPGDVAVAKLGVAVASSALFLIMWRLAYAVWSRPAKAHP